MGNFKASPSLTSPSALILNLFRANLFESTWAYNDNYNLFCKNNLSLNTSYFFSNPLKLRTTLKNLIVTYSAIQKVYKSRFDDGRSNMNRFLMGGSFIDYALLTEGRGSYEAILNKNKEFFFKANFFNTTSIYKFSPVTNFFTNSNFIFLDIPFLLSLKSDASRYL
jgi:hypothetical protein